MHRSSGWPRVRLMAWDPDRKAQAVCHICGQPIDYNLQPSSGADAWEPDHVIPVIKAPELELDLNNIKASHARCNRARGAGNNPSGELGMRSRIW
jgi:5-methylcytosine-specific restriction endonuclease McrA